MQRPFLGCPTIIRKYATWDPITSNPAEFSPDYTVVRKSQGSVFSTIGKSTGKWYWEFQTDTGRVQGISKKPFTATANYIGSNLQSYGYYPGARAYTNATFIVYGATYAGNDIIGVLLDMDNGEISFSKNGVNQGVAYTGLSGEFFAAMAMYNFGNNGQQHITANFGATPFAYTPPIGYNKGLFVDFIASA